MNLSDAIQQLFNDIRDVAPLIAPIARVRQCLSKNGEVIGSDEQFCEDETQIGHLKDL